MKMARIVIALTAMATQIRSSNSAQLNTNASRNGCGCYPTLENQSTTLEAPTAPEK